ncbi:hypothetical protein F5144DRAFT_313330 [Chaetomium tenue]|uniref:Uncharacterized protein n=1 Tax=Chaetomium tenue TaxID=1854479 RepID=A0ACB7P3L9_9PEZI|nr:hypothetical protein F5144DRAFT_313330 [Chaetomium globosum]
MQLNRALRFLVLGLSAVSVAEATFAGANIAGRRVKEIQRRQDDDAKDDPNTTEAGPPEQTSTSVPADPTSEEPESTPPPVTSSTPTKPPVTSTPATSTPAPTSSNKPPSSSANDDNNDSATTSHSAKPTSSADEDAPGETTITSTQIITTTREDGSPVTYTSETTSTETPGLADDNNSGQESGMSPQTRNTVIGVVVGVGGAIILGGLALVAWRIWGRKKHQDENDGLMDYGSAIESKPETGGSLTSRTPFQSTLESYHAPTQVNTAANF